MSDIKERLADMSVLSQSRTPADALKYIEELEAKLAWAVGELEEMLMFQNSEAAYGILRVYTKVLVAELKGKTNE
jgi:hypothetical protein